MHDLTVASTAYLKGVLNTCTI